MQIEITGETERLVQAALASGKYATAEEFIKAGATKLLRDEEAEPVYPKMPEHVGLETLISLQNIKPCEDPFGLRTDLWPKEESLEEFPDFLHDSRRDRSIGELPDLRVETASERNSSADEWPARWEDDDIMSEAWDQHHRGVMPLPLLEIQAAMRGIEGKLSDDICDGRDDRL